MADPNDFFSAVPTEIRIEFFKRCDALTLYLNWTMASLHLTSLSMAPTPNEIWKAVLQTDYPGDIGRLPLVAIHRPLARDTKTHLPDAAMLCEFITSRSMLQRIYDSGLSVPERVFSDPFDPPRRSYNSHPVYAVHSAMRHCWLDLVDIWNLSEDDKIRFAVRGSHWDYFEYVMTQRPDLDTSYYNDFFDYAAYNGKLGLMMQLEGSVSGSKSAMDFAARNCHFHVIQWLHVNRKGFATEEAFFLAALNGHLDIVIFLHKNRRSEGNIARALGAARTGRHSEIIEYLGLIQSPTT